jgi:predicted nucleotidyltransferase
MKIMLFEKFTQTISKAYAYGILQDVSEHIKNVLSELEYDIDEVKPLKLILFGSRIKGTNTEDSDLDVLFLYKGTLRSKYIHDALNDDTVQCEYDIDIFACNVDDDESFYKKFQLEYSSYDLPIFLFD